MNVKQLFLTFAFILLATTSVRAEESLTFSNVKAQLSDISVSILKEAYSRVNITIQTKELPAGRALEESNGGYTDGEVHRILFPHGRFPNLVRVDVPINEITGVALAISDLPIGSPRDLKSYRVGIKTGNLFAEKLVKGHGNVIRMTYFADLISSLMADRLDLIIVNTLWANEKIHNDPSGTLRIVGPPLITIPLYHYVHIKHQSLVPLLENVLRNMQAHGELKQIRNAVLQQYKAR